MRWVQVKVLVKKVCRRADVPRRAFPCDVGYDLCSVEDVRVPPRGTAIVRTGIALAMPEGVWAKVESRSGLACRGVFVIGGIIDPGYRGEVKVILANISGEEVSLPAGSRVAQLVFYKGITPDLEEVEELPDSPRGVKGLGSTGT